MEKFITLSDTAVPLNIDNVDTDQIIPARFLKATDKNGFGDNLFRDWRFNKEGKINSEFVLNDPRFKGSILVAGNNFGCGSSREHAAWALKAYGFKVVVSSFFADIFKGNALNNGLLTIQVSPSFLEELFKVISEHPSEEILIDLKAQKIEVPAKAISEKFDIDPYKKTCMINGFDDIDYLMSKLDAIKKYENKQEELGQVLNF